MQIVGFSFLLLPLLLMGTRVRGASMVLECLRCEESDLAACLSHAGCKPEEESASDGDPNPKEPCRGRECARGAGEPCGVYTPSCARGLRCIPRVGEKTPLQALLHGKGICRKVGARRSSRNQTTQDPQPGESRRDNRRAKESRPTQEPVVPQQHLLLINSSKEDVFQSTQDADIKQEPEVAPCRVHLVIVLQELKASVFRSPKDMYIPNCDTKGFYRRKQCRSSKGLRRGQCWCVDKKGHPLPGSEGSSHCLSGGGGGD
ncbi:insulin-like growth factor-binding protein 6 [Rhinatrema bivittatum]|uniref:insulin-like growth factor-binding protein 6 n=1 Tax=Rhinatrema bivittatum TaxID=194408 RepID=UPI001126FC4E|nr:insulin-like growth factor-binding protein 6 [Rhinatrema bivittatum]